MSIGEEQSGEELSDELRSIVRVTAANFYVIYFLLTMPYPPSSQLQEVEPDARVDGVAKGRPENEVKE